MKKEEARILGQIEGKIDSLIIDLKRLRESSEHEIKDLEVKVHNLEKKQYTIVVIASAIFTTVIALIKKFLPF